MAFNIAAWSRNSGACNNTIEILQDGSYAGAPCLYTYITPDTIATVSAANYFNLVAPVLNVGDIIFCQCSNGQVNLSVATVVVQPPSVTTTTGTSIGDVIGPASSIQYQPAMFADTTGKVITGGLQWVDQTTTPVNLQSYVNYLADKSTLITFNMPATVPQFATFTIAGFGSGGWLLQMNTGQTAQVGSHSTTSAGSLASSNQYDVISLICTVANTTFLVTSVIGNITYA